MEGTLSLIITRVQHLKDIELAAPALPAAAPAVLARQRDLGVQQPQRGDVGLLAGGALVVGHLELEEEDLVGAGESGVADGAGLHVAAVRAIAALLVGEDGELLARGDGGVGEGLRGGGAGEPRAGEVRERVAEGRRPGAGAGDAAVVAQEGQAAGGAGVGGVVGRAGVVGGDACGGGVGGGGLGDDGGRGGGGDGAGGCCG